MNKIKVTKLKIIEDEKGPIMHALKNSDDAFKRFGEIYFSEIYFGKIKGWKRHVKMHMKLIVPEGFVKFVFYDAKSNQPVIIYLEPLFKIDPVCACVHSAGHIKVLFFS